MNLRDDDGEISTWVVLLIGFIGSLLTATGLILFVRWQITETRREAAAEAARQVAAFKDPQITALRAELDKVNATVEALGGVKGPSADDVLASVPQDTRPAATDEQVRSAVALYLLANPLQPGRPPTDAEVDRAVAVYCSANNCRGQPGESVVGRDGRDGAPGPGPTDQQVADDVAAFCTANNNCAGPKGDKGDKGDPGDPATACPPGSSQQPRPAPPPYVAETWTVCVAA